MSLLPFRDSSDLPAASHFPDIAGEVDHLEDVLVELIAEQGPAMPEGLRRVVVALASGALRLAEERGIVQQMFGAAAPLREDLQDLARRIMERIDGDRNPRLEARCVNFVFGLGLDGGNSQTAIAREEGVGRACVSQRCIALRKDFDRPPARGMKTDAAREKYRARELAKPKRPREAWGFAGLFGRAFAV